MAYRIRWRIFVWKVINSQKATIAITVVSFFLAKKILKHYEITTKDGKIIYGIDNLFCPTCGSFNIKAEDKCAKD